MEWSNSHTYFILASLFVIVFPIAWEKGIKGLIHTKLNHLVLVEWEQPKYRILDFLYRHHLIVSFVLIGLGILFGFLGLS